MMKYILQQCQLPSPVLPIRGQDPQPQLRRGGEGREEERGEERERRRRGGEGGGGRRGEEEERERGGR